MRSVIGPYMKEVRLRRETAGGKNYNVKQLGPNKIEDLKQQRHNKILQHKRCETAGMEQITM